MLLIIIVLVIIIAFLIGVLLTPDPISPAEVIPPTSDAVGLWVNIADGLPPEGDQVVVHMAKMGRVEGPSSEYFGWYENGKWTIEADGREIHDADNNPDYWIVTHWMMLPSPWKTAA